VVITEIEERMKGNMKGMYSGNEDWLSRQRWIPIVLVAVAVIGGWAVGFQRKQAVADQYSEAEKVQPMVQKRQAPKQAAPQPGAAGTPAPPPAVGAKVRRVSVVQSRPAKSLGDPAKPTKQHKACLELVKDNPSIICK
jgi:hypothetical protein